MDFENNIYVLINNGFPCLFLSLMVSNLNSLATVLWEDFVSQLPTMKGLSDRKQVLIIKLLGK